MLLCEIRKAWQASLQAHLEEVRAYWWSCLIFGYTRVEYKIAVQLVHLLAMSLVVVSYQEFYNKTPSHYEYSLRLTHTADCIAGPGR